MAELHGEIKACDGILANMETLLGGFKNELGNIGNEIQTLQDQSNKMGIQLRNRLSTQNQMSAVIDGALVSPELIHKICNGQINDVWISHLIDLNNKMTFIRNHYGKSIHIFRDVIPELEKLRLKACDRIREFLIEKIKSLRNPSANIAIIQQHILLKYKDLYWFLLERHGEAATEVRAVYVNTVGNYYHTLFEKYAYTLVKLQTVGPEAGEFLGAVAGEMDYSASSYLPSFGLFKSTPTSKSNVYSLGDRVNLLLNGDSGIILLHVAESTNQRYPFESIFKSLNRVLLDNASSEYVFTYEFFVSPKNRTKTGHKGTGGPAMASAVFDETFKPTSSIIMTIVKEYTESTFDAIGLLMSIRLNQQHGLIMAHRRIPCLDDYINAVNLLLWPRFQSIMDMHIDSVKRASASRCLPNKDVHPHYMIRRYAEFASSVLFLNQGYDDALLLNSLARLRLEVESLLQRMGAEFTDKRKRLIFLINNYDLVSGILSGYTAPSFDAEKAYFSSALGNAIAEYVEQLLRPLFGSLIRFVADHQKDKTKLADGGMFETIAKDFQQRWKPSLDDISSNVMQSFSNFHNGSRVLQGAVTRLLNYYRQFNDLWERKFVNGPPPPMGLQSLMIELKRWLAKSSFE
jgi:hypothetical protein